MLRALFYMAFGAFLMWAWAHPMVVTFEVNRGLVAMQHAAGSRR